MMLRWHVLSAFAWLISMVVMGSVPPAYAEPIADDNPNEMAASSWRNPIKKKGYFDSPLVEVTPFTFKGELYLMECWRSGWAEPKISREEGVQRNEIWIAHLPQGPEGYDKREYVGRAMTGHTLGSALVWDDRVYVFAAATQTFHGMADAREISMSWSDDLKNWSEPVTVLTSRRGGADVYPRGHVFNVTATRDEQGMVFLWETNGVGRPFTMCFGRVDQPTDHWEPGIIPEARYGMDKYTGGPALHYEDGWYYLLYLESLGGRRWETRITRSRDLIHWQDAPQDRPFITFNPDRTGMPMQPAHYRERNASDVELCYHNGRTIIFYSGGVQTVAGDLAWATFDGTPRELLEHFFEGVDEIEQANSASNASEQPLSEDNPIRVLILSGQNNHNWRQTTPKLKSILETGGLCVVDVHEKPHELTAEKLAPYDVVLSNWNTFVRGEDVVREWSEEVKQAYLDFVKGGKGHVVVHAGSSSFYDWQEYHELCLATWKIDHTSHGRQHTFKVRIDQPDHPITRGIEDFETRDELWRKPGVSKDANVIASSYSDAGKGGTGQWEPTALTGTFGQGRSFTLLLGHDTGGMSNDGFEALLRRGVMWSAGRLKQ